LVEVVELVGPESGHLKKKTSCLKGREGRAQQSGTISHRHLIVTSSIILRLAKSKQTNAALVSWVSGGAGQWSKLVYGQKPT